MPSKPAVYVLASKPLLCGWLWRALAGHNLHHLVSGLGGLQHSLSQDLCDLHMPSSSALAHVHTYQPPSLQNYNFTGSSSVLAEQMHCLTCRCTATSRHAAAGSHTVVLEMDLPGSPGSPKVVSSPLTTRLPTASGGSVLSPPGLHQEMAFGFQAPCVRWYQGLACCCAL